MNLSVHVRLITQDLDGGNTSGLIQRAGTEKLAYEAWKVLSESEGLQEITTLDIVPHNG